jgi:hypothetical protein
VASHLFHHGRDLDLIDGYCPNRDHSLRIFVVIYASKGEYIPVRV